jgi:hypothetical protein
MFKQTSTSRRALIGVFFLGCHLEDETVMEGAAVPLELQNDEQIPPDPPPGMAGTITTREPAFHPVDRIEDDVDYWGRLSVWLDLLSETSAIAELECRQQYMAGWTGICNIGFEVGVLPNGTDRGIVTEFLIASATGSEGTNGQTRVLGRCRDYARCVGERAWVGRPCPVAPPAEGMWLKSKWGTGNRGSQEVVTADTLRVMRDEFAHTLGVAPDWRQEYERLAFERKWDDFTEYSRARALARLANFADLEQHFRVEGRE